MIIYISRGLLNSLIEAKRVMSTIASENELLQNRVIINTYAVVDGTEVSDNLQATALIGSYINTETLGRHLGYTMSVTIGCLFLVCSCNLWI